MNAALTGRGVFASELRLGPSLAVLMLGMLMIYAIPMSLLYPWMTGLPRTKAGAPAP